MVWVWFVCSQVEMVLAYEVTPALSGAELSGRVAFRGTLPKPKGTLVDQDRAVCGETIPTETLRVDPDSLGVTGAVITLEGVTKGKPFPESPALEIESRSCRFLPRVSATVVGAVLGIQNADPILHNTHIRQGDEFGLTLINVAQPPGGMVIKKPLREAGLLDIRCRKHSFMRGALHVFDHPYFAITDEAGRFQMTQVPPGTYTLKVWHEDLGTRTKMIRVPSSGHLIIGEVEFGRGKP